MHVATGLGSERTRRYFGAAKRRLHALLKSRSEEPSTLSPLFRDAESIGALLAMRVTKGRTEPVNTIGPPSDITIHAASEAFVSLLRLKPEGRLLEVGSRARSGVVRHHFVPEGWKYTGFDVREGPNVDAIGDAHKLSQYFPPDHFDAVMAFAVLEHLMMPWKFAIELNRVMKTGGVGFFIAPQTWPIHDMPWDFWRFSDEAWKAILNTATGFEIIEAKMAEPTYVVPCSVHSVSNFSDVYLGYLASVVIFRKVSNTTLQWPVEIEHITDTAYPAHQV